MAKYVPKYLKAAPVKKRRGRLLVPVLASAVVLLLALTASLTWDSLAKYVRQRDEDSIAKAKEFYFTSDYLTAGGATYTLNEGIDSFSFQIRNYQDSKRSELDIDYTVTVISDGTYSMAAGTESGTLFCTEDDVADIVLTNLVGGNTYTVTVTGENGYAQTLSAKITVKASKTGIYKNVQNFDDYVLLTVWTENASGTVNITVPEGLIPDETDSLIRQNLTGSVISIPLEAYESQTFRFFTTGSYAGDGFTVTFE